MKKIMLLNIFLLSLLSYSQSSITRDSYFTEGDVVLNYNKFDISLENFTSGDSGENVVWDYSNMDFEHPSVIVDTLNYISPIGTPFFPTFLRADYSAANLCYVVKKDEFSSENNNYNYIYIDSGKFENIGNWADNPSNEIWENHYINPIKELSFPFTYEDTYTDDFERFFTDQSSGIEHTLTGTVEIAADSFGTLITPEGVSLNDVIRIHRVEEGVDTNSLGQSNPYTKNNFYWYSSTVKGAILSFEMSINDPNRIETANYEKSFLLGTEEFSYKSLVLFPNPASSKITISPIEEIIKEIKVYNVMGLEVITVQLHPNGSIDIEALKPGMYLMQISYLGGGYEIKKMIKI